MARDTSLFDTPLKAMPLRSLQTLDVFLHLSQDRCSAMHNRTRTSRMLRSRRRSWQRPASAVCLLPPDAGHHLNLSVDFTQQLCQCCVSNESLVEPRLQEHVL